MELVECCLRLIFHSTTDILAGLTLLKAINNKASFEDNLTIVIPSKKTKWIFHTSWNKHIIVYFGRSLSVQIGRHTETKLV